MKAEIITIGDEILIGQIIDTNSAWIAEQFNLNGIEICRITTVRDNHDHITEALKNADYLMNLLNETLAMAVSDTGRKNLHLSSIAVNLKFNLSPILKDLFRSAPRGSPSFET